MAEEIWTGIEIGPFDNSKLDDVMAALKSITDEYEYGYENRPEVRKDDDGVRIVMTFGHVNYGASNMFEPLGRVASLMDLEVPYALHDDGKPGVGVGSDFSWHPSYGEFVKHRERNIDSELVLSERRFKMIGPVSDEDLGKAVRAYFAEPGSQDATDGWPIWKQD